jgi:hypothetical protein
MEVQADIRACLSPGRKADIPRRHIRRKPAEIGDHPEYFAQLNSRAFQKFAATRS